MTEPLRNSKTIPTVSSSLVTSRRQARASPSRRHDTLCLLSPIGEAHILNRLRIVHTASVKRHPVLVTYLLLQLSEWSTDFWMDSKIRAKQVAIDAVLGSSEEENSIRKLAMSGVPLVGKREAE